MKFKEVILNEDKSTIEVSSMKEFNKLTSERNSIISKNKSRLMGGKGSPLPVPPKPILKKIPVAYKKDGTYEGRLNNPNECPKDCVVKWENPKY